MDNSRSMKVVITGAAGLLGSEFCAAVQNLGWEAVPFTRNELDLKSAQNASGLLEDLAPDVIIHCAAETNVDLCESDPEHAKLINETASHELALAAQKIGAKMVYISSCGIFDGLKRTPYTEQDAPSPLTEYAASKYQGELRVLETSPDNLACRVGWLFGGGREQRKNFVEARRKEAASGGDMVSANDKWGSPTWARDAAERIIALVERNAAGVFHVSNTGIASRHDYVSEIVRTFYPLKQVGSVDSSSFNRAAPVPDFEALESSRLEELGLRPLRSWQDAIQSYVALEYADLIERV